MQKTKFIIKLNNGLIFTSYKKPTEDEFSIIFYDREGLYKSFPKEKYEPEIQEVQI